MPHDLGTGKNISSGGRLTARNPHQACGEKTQEACARTCQTKYQLWTAARVRLCLQPGLEKAQCEPDPTRTSGGRRNSNAQHGKEVTPETVSKTIGLPASRPKRKRLLLAPTSCLSGKLASKHEEATGVRLVGKHRAASDFLGGSHVEGKRQNNEETENDVIFSELDFRRGIRRCGSRAKQRQNESIEAVPREGVLAEAMVSLTAVGRASDQQLRGPASKT